MVRASNRDETPETDSVNESSSPNQPDRAVHQVAVQKPHPIDAYIPSLPTPFTLRPPACLTCRRRKVRCDKKVPCLNCKQTRTHCAFPTSKIALRYHHDWADEEVISQREHELMNKLERLEGVVKALSNKIEADRGPKAQTSCHLLDEARGNPAGKDKTGGDKRLRWRAMRPLLSASTGSRASAEDMSNVWLGSQSPDDEALDFLNSNPTFQDSFTLGAYPADPSHLFLPCQPVDEKLTRYHPLPCQIAFLWLTYQENIEPFIKVLHVPSIELVMRCATKNRSTLTAEQQALAFAIYFAGIASLNAEEIETNFGTTKADLLSHYQFAFEQALSNAKFLHTADITILQALSIFLAAVRPHCELGYCRSLTGLLIRLAQGMGLHRDGTHLGLGPFETEIRRRIWWQMLILDVRCAEELGTNLIVGTSGYDALMPSNVNDVDIGPNISQVLPEREGTSDCALVLIRYEILALNRAVQHASSTLESTCESENDLKISNLDDREQILAEACKRIEDRFFKHVWNQKVEPMYWMMMIVARLVTAKISLVMYQPKLFPGSDDGVAGEFEHRFYTAAVEIMECSVVLNDDDQFSPYRWLATTYTNWHALSHYLIETCRHPWAPLAERGWLALNRNENLSVFLKGRDHASLIQPLETLRARVASHRTNEMARLRANHHEAQRLNETECADSMQTCMESGLHSDNTMELIREAWRLMMSPKGHSTSSQINALPMANFDQGINFGLSTGPALTADKSVQDEIEEKVLGQNLDSLDDDDQDVAMVLESLDWESWSHTIQREFSF